MAPEDPCLGLSTQVCQFKTAHDFSCRVSDALLWPLRALAHAHTDTHNYKINIPFLEKILVYSFKIFSVHGQLSLLSSFFWAGGSTEHLG